MATGITVRLLSARYIRLARLAEDADPKYLGAETIEDALGRQPRRKRHSPWNKIRDIADRVNVASVSDERQAAEAVTSGYDIRL
jgi:hypothetical protein